MLKNYLTFDNLGVEFEDFAQDVRSGLPTAVFGVNFAERCHLATGLETPLLYIVKDGFYGARVAEQMRALSGEEVVLLPAKDDVLLYKSAFDKERLYSRLKALYQIKSGAKIVIATLESLLQLFPKDVPFITIEKGGEYDLYDLAKKLVEMGYKRQEFADEKGTFAIRGDIFEVYPVNEEKVYRTDFFGDEAESIRRYDSADKEQKEAVTSFTAICATDALISQRDVTGIKERLRQSLLKFSTLIVKNDARKIVDEINEKLDSENYVADCLQFLMPILPSVTTDFLSYMPSDTVVAFDECKMLADGLSAVVKEHTERTLSLSRSGKAFDFTIKQMSDGGALLSALNQKRRVAFQNITTAINFFNPLKTYSFKCSPVTRYSVKPTDLFKDVANWKFNGYRVIICCGNTQRAENLVDQLYDHGVTAIRADDTHLPCGTAAVTTFFLPSGFIYHQAKTVVVGTGDLYIEKEREKRLKRKRGDLFQAPEIGDYAVHEVHGIGHVVGVERITTQEGSKDYVAVKYFGGDTLYVGVDQMDRLTKYVGGDVPKLNKIGGHEFERIKARVKESIAAMAIDLKKLYNARKVKKGYEFSEDTVFSEEFEQAFEFEPTEDQLQSVKEIKADMQSPKVMDRLLCGDVGFGKTEVAFRAAFKAVYDGKQVALVCPTTILCEQHYRAAKQRFKDFGVKVASLNRFKTLAQQKDVIKKLADGEINFVIGTHRLFGKDVVFNDLGLLILDEEQRFGVEHKEQLKLLKENVDTLTMTATPIPRTLHMSLSGIRDISTIHTPPRVRIPVQTYVIEESEALIRDAVRRELARGGQALILYNRVETIYKFSSVVQAILPDAKVIVAHGQMDRKTLEDSVMKFYDGEYDVLIATTIIENGIDLPRANTLIVIDSDHLGLSTLYQLKGRVGRSDKLAHAYFTFKPDKVLSETAYKRLSALMEFTDMGSGYKIAMRDLEIRGAGNVLGKEQHGHMDKIGYELYSKLLKESLGEKKVEKDVELDVKMNAYIPETYIGSPPSRMDCYKQIAEIQGDEDESRIRSSLAENYGKVPLEVDNLILIARLKLAVKARGGVKITLSSKRAAVEFDGIESLNSPEFIDRIQSHASDVRFTVGAIPALVFNVEGRSVEDVARLMLGVFSGKTE
ncbi:MAG: transcription-repair coupling factor [Clostridia bacterium]|nr:transcription-repair coupling factor [Clostridia bacterium]